MRILVSKLKRQNTNKKYSKLSHVLSNFDGGNCNRPRLWAWTLVQSTTQPVD